MIEARRRHQEPRAVRGACGAGADRRAPRTGRARADEGRARGQARARTEVGEARLRRRLVQRLVRQCVRRVLRGDAGARHGRRPLVASARAPQSSTGRRSDHALYSESLASYGDRRDLSSRRGGRFHRDRGAGDRARCRTETEAGRMTLWSGRVGTDVAPEVWGLPARRRRRLLPYDCLGDARSTHVASHAGGLLDRRGARRRRAAARLDRAPRGARLTTRTSTRRSSASWAVGRRIHAGRSRNDQVAAALRLYVADACRGGGTAIRGLSARSRPRRGRGRDADARLYASAAGAADHGRAPPAGLGRDARPRPRPLPARRRRRRGPGRSAPERWPARRSSCRRLPGAHAELPRRGRRP